jgi:transcriptional regulator with XRE-family HTH domain
MREKAHVNIVVGNNIRQQRLKKSFSQEYLAELAGVHRTYIGIVERAERNITLVSLEKISKALNVDISEFFNE